MSEKNTIKIVIAGDGGVGKTVLTHHYIHNNYDEKISMTKGVDFFTLKVNHKDSHYDLIIWDLAGQRQFKFFLSDFIEGSVGGMVLFDFSRYFTLINVEKWIDLMNEHKEFPILVVGSKYDLVKMNEARVVSYEHRIKKIMDERENCFGYIRTSSKEDLNVKESFNLLLDYLFKEENKKRI